MKHPLIYRGPGNYTLTVNNDGKVWQLDTTGNPLWAVNVPCITNVRKFATLVRVEAYEKEEKK